MHLHGMGLQCCDATSIWFSGILGVHWQCRAIPRSRSLLPGMSRSSGLLANWNSYPSQCNQTGHWASGNHFNMHLPNLSLTAPFQIAPMLPVRVDRNARRLTRREVILALAISAVRKVTGPAVRYSLHTPCTTVADQRVACPNPDGGPSKTKPRTATRATTTSKRGAKTTRSTSGSSTKGGKGTKGKKAASKFAAADEW